MIKTIKAKFTGGSLKPLEPLDLEDGVEVTLHIENGATPHPQSRKPERTTSFDASAPSISEFLRDIRESSPKPTRDDMPTDGAKNVKSYLYGWPTENDN